MFKSLQKVFAKDNVAILPSIYLEEEVKEVKPDYISNKKANQEFMKSVKSINEFLKGGISKLTTTNISKESLFIKLSIILNPNSDYLLDNTSEQWDIVNALLLRRNAFDYNIDLLDRYNHMNELFELQSRIRMAVNDLEPYMQLRCKECNKIYTLNYGEIVFYVESNLYVPKRCNECRKIRTH